MVKEFNRKGKCNKNKDIKKDDTVLVDIPVNAGIAAGVIAIIIPPILALVVSSSSSNKSYNRNN